SQKIENSVEDLESKETPVAIQGMEKRPFEEILRLLASAQPKIAVSASNELLRRGMARPQLEIAVALAQGDAQARSEAMDQLVRDTSFDSVPWLVWMAEQADPKVRRKAIAMLGSMSSPEAMRKLRLLKQRESDSSIADQINQVLLAAGTPSNTIR
ncbi:MAG: HEAT repeat domain-containing protein, partial [Pirellula sp.]